MITLYDQPVFLVRGREIVPHNAEAARVLGRSLGRDVALEAVAADAAKGTMTWKVLSAHNQGDEKNCKIIFDSLTTHDLTGVNIIQTARASGMKAFPLPLAQTNCHGALCAVGGTINEDDHKFGLSAAKRFGGIYVPANLAVLHSFNREAMAGCGRMILGSDSHTRYGALGTVGIGEGGAELAKQLVGRTYDVAYPPVVAVYLTGKLQRGVGPHDVALSLVKAVFASGFVQNKMLEFVGDGIAGLSVDCRNGIDVMTTETACWSTIWETDDAVREYFEIHGRPEAYEKLSPGEVARYDGMAHVDLSRIEPSIALPFHPGNVHTIRELKENAADILASVEKEAGNVLGTPGKAFSLRSKLRGGEIYADQGIVCGCAGGTFENIMAVASVLEGASTGNGGFSLSVYPGSQPIFMELVRNGALAKMLDAGAIMRSAFCGPCFGAGDIPANGAFSLRHATRNFPNREGSKPGDGQAACVALMDARSIAATAANGGRLTAATELDRDFTAPKYFFAKGIYEKRVYNGTGRPDPSAELALGPNIRDWPEFPPLAEDLLIRIVSCIADPVTTTDELIPAGETSSLRSNPIRLAEFTLSRKDPGYVSRARAVAEEEKRRLLGEAPGETLMAVYAAIRSISGLEKSTPENAGIGSAIYAHKPGDGSSREQAASCQRILGACANFAREYATKRYRSNLINWGILPFVVDGETCFSPGDHVLFPGIRRAVEEGARSVRGYVINNTVTEITVFLDEMTGAERRILMDGCLINHYRRG